MRSRSFLLGGAALATLLPLLAGPGCAAPGPRGVPSPPAPPSAASPPEVSAPAAPAPAAPASATPASATAPAPARPTPPPAGHPDDALAAPLLEVYGRFRPELLGLFGIDTHDTAVFDLGPGVDERFDRALARAETRLRASLPAARSPAARQDLEILLAQTRHLREETRLNARHLVDYTSVARLVFLGLSTLLDRQSPPERQRRALERLRRYAGLIPGQRPLTELAEQRTREQMAQATAGSRRRFPPRAELERDLATSRALTDGLGPLFARAGLTGHEPALATLRKQLAAYDRFVREVLLPRSRPGFRLHPELYRFRLRQNGIDLSAEKLAARARRAFRQTQREMDRLARVVAPGLGLPTAAGYRAVLAALKKQQLEGPGIVKHYEGRLAQLEALIRKHRLVTLPGRPLRFRLATAAESVAQPAPTIRIPNLRARAVEHGVIILPLNVPGQGKGLRYDDFTYDAVSWTLAAHEGWPGHDLQFAIMTERRVSLARALFAFNSVNVEGWGLYAEFIVLPFMPPAAQLASLQGRLLRAARAFLEPELQLGRIDLPAARRVLREDVVASEAMAKNELDRYTFSSVSQAPCYFFGFTRLLELRREAERRLGPRFDATRFHDAILGQGLLPPALLRRAVLAVLGAR